MKKLSKRKIESIYSELFKTHANCVQFNIFDLSKISNAVEKVLTETGDVQQAEKVMIDTIAQYRLN